MENASALDTNNYNMINFEETELRLGLPGLKSSDSEGSKSAKRGFLHTVDLKLNLSSKPPAAKPLKSNDATTPHSDPAKPPSKAQVVGWPPIRSFRKNAMAAQKSSVEESEEKEAGTRVASAFVKVSVDGAPYLRKVDLKQYKSYRELSSALSKMLGLFVNESSGDPVNGSDYVPTYEDKDGDWMLVGDVPWEMFVASCKRLRMVRWGLVK